MDELRITDFLPNKVWYDNDGQMIFVENPVVGDQLVLQLDIRGWARISNMHKENGKFNDEAAEKYQDKLGKWIADAINEKWERDFGSQ